MPDTTWEKADRSLAYKEHIFCKIYFANKNGKKNGKKWKPEKLNNRRNATVVEVSMAEEEQEANIELNLNKRHKKDDDNDIQGADRRPGYWNFSISVWRYMIHD